MKGDKIDKLIKKTIKLEKNIERNMISIAKTFQAEEEKMTASNEIPLDKKRIAKISYKIEVRKK